MQVNAIAVLPFVSLSATPEDDAFCDGVTEEVTAALARVEGLKVPSRTVMAQHKGKSVDLRKLASELGVQAFLEGSLRREGSRYLFTAQLIDAREGFHMWAETYDHSSASRLDLQRDVASSMARAVAQRARGRQKTEQPPSSEAVNAYVRANDLLRTDPRATGWSRGVPREHQEAIKLLTRATQIEPRFSSAWSALAQAYLIASEYDQQARPRMIQQAKVTARHAIELDESLGEAWATLGDIAFYVEWNLGEAERAIRRSIELQPRDARSQQQYADLLRITGRRNGAGFELNRAIALAPSDANLRAQRALHLYDEGQFEQCRAEAEQSLHLRPNYTMAMWLRGLCFQAERRWADAEREFRHALAIAPADGRALPALANLYAQMGRQSEAAALVARMRKLADQGRPIHYALALVHAGSGSSAAAIRELELAFRDHDPNLLYMTVERRFENIAREPGFVSMARRIGLRL
jgi:TolB-like protein/Tfp pilus assembly protein PilF